MRLAQTASRAILSHEPLPAGTAWLDPAGAAAGAAAAPPRVSPARANDVAVDAEAHVVPAERPAQLPGRPMPCRQMPTADGARIASADVGAAAIGAAAREECGTRFPLALDREPAAQLPLRPTEPLATISIRDDGTLIDGSPAAPVAAPPWAGLRALGVEVPVDIPLRVAALRDELSIDAHRYAEDAGYRADVQRVQARAGAAAATAAIGGAAAGALLCSVQ